MVYLSNTIKLSKENMKRLKDLQKQHGYSVYNDLISAILTGKIKIAGVDKNE